MIDRNSVCEEAKPRVTFKHPIPPKCDAFVRETIESFDRKKRIAFDAARDQLTDADRINDQLDDCGLYRCEYCRSFEFTSHCPADIREYKRCIMNDQISNDGKIDDERYFGWCYYEPKPVEVDTRRIPCNHFKLRD